MEQKKKRNCGSIEITELNKSKIFKKLNINEMRLCSIFTVSDDSLFESSSV